MNLFRFLCIVNNVALLYCAVVVVAVIPALSFHQIFTRKYSHAHIEPSLTRFIFLAVHMLNWVELGPHFASVCENTTTLIQTPTNACLIIKTAFDSCVWFTFINSGQILKLNSLFLVKFHAISWYNKCF